MAFIGDIVNACAGKKVMFDTKDLYTGSARIVTDTAIDLGDLVTGFQFHKDMEKAKTTMDKAGVKSMKASIEDNHYGDIKKRAKKLERNKSSIGDLQKQATCALSEANQRVDLLNKMIPEVKVIVGLEKEIKDKLGSIDHYKLTYTMNDINKGEIQLQNSSQFIKTRKALTYTQISTSAISGITGTVSFLTKSGTSISKIAGRASLVLAVVSVGIDIGMAVAELDEKRSQLIRANNDANSIIKDLKSEKQKIEKDKNDINHKIKKILDASNQTETTFFSWSQSKIEELKDVLGKINRELKQIVINAITPLILSGVELPTIFEVAKTIDNSITLDACKNIIQEIKH